MAWTKGQSGNPSGRKPGSRNKLSERVIRDVLADWRAHGAEAIARCRAENATAYLRVVASLVPNRVDVQANGGYSLIDILRELGRQGAAKDPAPSAPGVTEAEGNAVH